MASWIARTSFCVMRIGARPSVPTRDRRRRCVRPRECGHCARRGAVDDAVLPDDAGEVHLRDHFDDARAADAGDAGRGGGLGEARLVRPQVAADDLEARLQRLRIDAHALDGARRRALAAADLRALEGRTGRARAGEQALVVAEHDLGIGADVDEQRHLLGEVRALGQHDAGGVGADVAGDAGQHVDARVAMDGEVDLGRPHRQRRVGRQRERRAAQLDRIDAEQQMMHDRVADERRLEDLLARDADLPRDVGDEAVDRGAHGVGHLLLAARIHHHVRDAAHQVLAEADLRIHHARGGDDLAARQVAQMRGDRRRADVDGEAVDALVEARPHRDDLAAAVHGDGHLPLALAQRRLQLLQHAHVALEARQPPLELERVLEPAEVAGGIVHVGRLHLDVVQADHGIELDVVRLGGLAHDLAVHLAVGRHVDDDVALDLRRAGKAPPGRHRLAAAVVLLDGAERREVGGARRHAVLGEFALGQHDLAAAADAAPAAHRIDVDAERARRLQQRRAERKAPAPPDGVKTTSASVLHGDQRRSRRCRARRARIAVMRAAACRPRAGRAPSRRRRRPPAPRGTS